MTPEVLAFCRQQALFWPGCRVVCAVSGGADSMALLHLLYTSSGKLGIVLAGACHLNHGLRGDESDADEALVRNFCSEHNIPLLAERTDALSPDMAGMELAARRLRYSLFIRAAERFSANVVATAHTATDQAETVLLRLARGCGLRGAGGIPTKRGIFVRPLLSVLRADTERYCEENGVPFRLDSSNQSDRYARNRVRNHALPALSSVSDGAVASISRFAAFALRADALLQKQAAALLCFDEKLQGCAVQPLLSADALLQEYAVMELLQQSGTAANAELVSRCRAVLLGGGRTQIAQNCFFVRQGDAVRVELLQPRCLAETDLKPGVNLLENGRGLLVEELSAAQIHGKFSNLIFSFCLDCDKVNGNPILRTRREGDRFSSARRGVSKPVKKLLSEKRLPLRDRDNLLLIADDEGILWLEGEGPSRRAAVSENSKRVYKITVLKGE